jgi:SH3-like domain-containing protein
MNLFNIIASVVLACLIFGAVVFIKYTAQKKENITYPFFVSTKDEKTNLRSGPSLDYPVISVYNKPLIPLKVLEAYKEWYKVEDYNGKSGWVYKNIISKTKTAITISDSTSVYIASQTNSKILAEIKRNNALKILDCHKEPGKFCKIEIYYEKNNIKISGWVLKTNLWGAKDE